MKKYIRYTNAIIFLVAFLCLNFGPVNAQLKEYKINWQNNSFFNSYQIDSITKNRLNFDGALYRSDPRIPLYIESIKLGDTDPYKVFYFDDLVFEDIPDSIIHRVELPESVSSELTKINLYNGRGEKFLDFSICPLRISNKTGRWERLVSFAVKDSLKKDIVNASNTVKHAKSIKSSVLSQGNWYKIKISNDGIYKLTYSDIIGMGISDPANIRVYGNGGKQLSFLNSDSRPVDLNEVPIYMNKGSDAVFNDGDFILFYAQGTVRWNIQYLTTDFYMFKQHLHDYSDAAYYFLTSDKGPATQIRTVDNSSMTSTTDVKTFTDYGYYEKKLLNLIHSGRDWYSTRIDNIDFDTTFNFTDLVSGEPAKILSKVAGRAGSNRYFELLANDETIASGRTTTVSMTSNDGNYAIDISLKGTHSTSSNGIKTGIRFSKYEDSDRAYLDYITVNVRRNLKMSGSLLFFRDERSVGTGKVSKFIIDNANSDILIWDVTDINNPFNLKTQLSGSILQFKSNTGSLHEFAAFNVNSDFPKPALVSDENSGKVTNQNLRGLKTVNYIIVTAKVFKEQAERLAMFYHDNSDLSVLVVTPEEIYNEFSSGQADISALRDFFRYQYENSQGEDSLKYVLLFGDGSYNNHMNVEGNSNYILTYESEESLNHFFSFVSDDFYGLLDDTDDNINCIGKLEIGIGRFPAKLINGKTTEAELLVDKTINYTTSAKADWKSSFCFLGDDGWDSYSEGVIHMKQADDLTKTVSSRLSGADIKKILLDAYLQKTSSTGPAYPDAQKDLMNTLNKGVLVWNYTGHGGPGGITGEKVFQTQDVDNLKNKEKLFVFITASCSVSKFDDMDMENTSAYVPLNSCGEKVLLSPDGGAVALFSTTRVVSSGKNFQLNDSAYTHLFEKDAKGERKRFGEVIREAKNDLVSDYDNKINFALLGDPALVLQYPEYMVITDSINHKPVSMGPDTLRASQEVTVSGHIAFNDGTEISNFNGSVYPKVYDKEITITTLGNDNVTPYTYRDRKNLLYKGNASVKNGKFSFSFIVPIDISYKTGTGKISYYADNDSIDAQGSFSDLYIGGTADEIIIDNSGPEIELFMNDENFKDGGMTNDSPVLLANLSDDNGINTTGIGIGHDITGILDEDHSNLLLLNDFYQANEDDSRSGKVLFPFSQLTKGQHSLYIKAWDIFNNSSEAMITFDVTDADGIVLDKVLSYPNPATDNVVFQYVHNVPDEVHNVVLEVFDLTGRLIIRKEFSNFESGFISTPLEWDLNSDSGGRIQTGVYPYRIKVSTTLGTSYINNKLIIIK